MFTVLLAAGVTASETSSTAPVRSAARGKQNRVVHTGDCVLREVRLLARNPVVLLNVRMALPVQTWTVHFVHGPSNHQVVRRMRSLIPALEAGSLQLRMYTISGVVQTTSLDRHAHFNYQKSHQFWSSFSKPLLMLVEPDTVVCPGVEPRLDRFREYAFVGAPWSRDAGGMLPAWCFNLEHCVGNSGLSLWRRDVVAAAIATTTEVTRLRYILDYLQGHRGQFTPVRGQRPVRPGVGSQKVLRYWSNSSVALLSHAGSLLMNKTGVDVYMATLLQALRHYGILPIEAVPPAQLASQFSVETSYAGNYTPVGIHKAYRYQPAPKLMELMRRCPPFRQLVRATRAENSFADRRMLSGDQGKLSAMLDF